MATCCFVNTYPRSSPIAAGRLCYRWATLLLRRPNRISQTRNRMFGSARGCEISPEAPFPPRPFAICDKGECLRKLETKSAHMLPVGRLWRALPRSGAEAAGGRTSTADGQRSMPHFEEPAVMTRSMPRSSNIFSYLSGSSLAMADKASAEPISKSWAMHEGSTSPRAKPQVGYCAGTSIRPTQPPARIMMA